MSETPIRRGTNRISEGESRQLSVNGVYPKDKIAIMQKVAPDLGMRIQILADEEKNIGLIGKIQKRGVGKQIRILFLKAARI